MTITIEKVSPAFGVLPDARTRSQIWIFLADLCPALAAASLPWSTSAVSVFVGGWIALFIPMIDRKALAQTLKAPACFAPLLLFGLAVVGMLWTDSVWSVRLHG